MKAIFLVVIFTLIPGMLLAKSKAEEEFWSEQPTSRDSFFGSGPALPGKSFVDAGPMVYANFGDGPAKDEYTAGLKINASIRDYFEHAYLRLDGLLGLGGPVEGVAEVDVNLIKGLAVGVGGSYTKRLDFSLRFGIYVEDQQNSAKRAGMYLLRDESGGIEVSWPLRDRWTVNGDFGVEKESDDKYTRLVFGLMYRF